MIERHRGLGRLGIAVHAPPGQRERHRRLGPWGSQIAPLQTAADGLRLLPAGRNRDLPWFNINQIVLTLSRPANVSPGDVTVMGITGGIYGPVTISGSGTSTIVITLAKGITSADRVTVTIANSQIASYTRRLDILPGDVNDDGKVNRTDGDLILKHKTPAHAYRASFDLNGDHNVNSGDIKLDRQGRDETARLADSGRNPRSKAAVASRALDRALRRSPARSKSGTRGRLRAWTCLPLGCCSQRPHLLSRRTIRSRPPSPTRCSQPPNTTFRFGRFRPSPRAYDADSKTVVKRATATQQSRPHRVPLFTGE